MPLADEVCDRESDSDKKTYSEPLCKHIVTSRNILKISTDTIVQNMSYKCNKSAQIMSTERDAFPIGAPCGRSAPSDCQTVLVTNGNMSSSNQLSQKACRMNSGHAEAKVQHANVDIVISMLKSRMRRIYDSDSTVTPTHVQECKSDRQANFAERPSRYDVGHFTSEHAPISSDLDIDPISALSCRLSSILLQSPYSVS